jgi:hypothetical protein
MMLLVALFIVVPTLFLTTLASVFVYTWAMIGYYVFRWYNQAERPEEERESVSRKLDKISGERLQGLMDTAWKPPKSEFELSDKDHLLGQNGNGTA